MKQMKKYHIVSLLIFMVFSPLSGQLDNTQINTKSGTTAAQFLKIPLDARGSSMGGAFAGMAGDLGSVFWNPAGLTNLDRLEFVFINTDWLAETKLQHIGIGIPVQNYGILGVSVTQLTMPEERVRTVSNPEGTGEFWEASDLSAQLSYAKKLTNRFSIGGNLKFIQQKIWHASASTIATDLGVLFVTPFSGIRIGASLSNYGNDMKITGRDQKLSVDPDPGNQGNVEFVNALYETDSFPLPLIFRVGISGELVNSKIIRISYGIDALHPNDNIEGINSGIEIALGEMIYFRGGMTSLLRENSEEGLSFGGGLQTRIWRSPTRLKVDYCYQGFGRLDFVQRLSFGVVL